MTSPVLLFQVLTAHAKEPDDEDSLDPIPANERGWTSDFLPLKSRTISFILMVLRIRLFSVDQSIISERCNQTRLHLSWAQLQLVSSANIVMPMMLLGDI